MNNKNNALYLLKAYSVRLTCKVFLASFNTFRAKTIATAIVTTAGYKNQYKFHDNLSSQLLKVYEDSKMSIIADLACNVQMEKREVALKEAQRAHFCG